MRATVMYAAGDVRVETVPDPHLVEPTDAVVRVSRAAICGSDLWPYKTMPPSQTGRRMGHELIGIVESIGSDVRTLKVGQLTETISVWASRGGAAANPPSSPPVARRPAPDKFAMMKECAERTPTAGSMGGNLRQPTKVRDVKPLYPEQLAEAGTGGVFVFAALIGTDGIVRDLQTTSGANPDLEQSAAAAIRQWEFTPTLLNCVAVEVPMTITVSFKPAP